MIRRMIGRSGGLVTLLFAAFLTGCAAAAIGAGAAAAVHLSGNNATTELNAQPARVDGWTRAALDELRVHVAERRETERGFEYRGHGPNGQEISVDVERTDASTTRVTASARRSPVEFDNEFARTIVSRIVSRAPAR